jgi:hypothetical protein
MNPAITRSLTSLISMLLIIGAAAGADRWARQVEAQATMTFEPISVWWALTIGRLLLMVLCAALFWFVVCKSPRNNFVSLLFIIVGLSLTFYNLLAYYLPGLNFSRMLLPQNLIIVVSAFITATGAMNLLRTIGAQINNDDAEGEL